MRGLSVLALTVGLSACGEPVELEVAEHGGGGTISAPPAIEIVSPAGVGAMAMYPITGTGLSTEIASFEWLGSPIGFNSVDPPCTFDACPFIPGSFPLPRTGMISCVPGIMPVASTFRLTSNSGAATTVQITCRPPTAGPSFSVSSVVGRVTAPVNGTASASAMVTNTGDAALLITASLDGSASSLPWSVLDCAETPCMLGVGSSLAIPLAFAPTEHGDFDPTLEVTGPPAVGTQTAMLLGTGEGGKLRVDTPADFILDFGTIAKNQLVSLPIAMTNVGNVALQVTPSSPGAPFNVATMPLTIGAAQQGQLSVSCMAGAETPLQTEPITLTTDAYAQNTPSVEARCAIANTTVQVTNPLDFGELRTGTAPASIEVGIANPPGSPTVTISRVALVGGAAFPALKLEATGIPATLIGGAQLSPVTLTLKTDADVELAGVTLEVDVVEVDTVTLAQPVKGKVGTPAAIVLPAQLELGSVCLGTPVDGRITMSNTGTATLTIQRPTMSSPSFVPLFTNPTDYPAGGAPLAPGDKATVDVMLAATTAGLQEGSLVWEVDAPGAPFETAVSVELLEEGTAVSPAELRFNPIDITAPPATAQLITIENCGPDPATVGYDRVAASEGTPSAWKLDPPSQARELLPDETLRVRVAFDPEQPGHHLAELRFSIGAGENVVRLEGDATGSLPEETSFYACGCSGSSDPTRGWPLALALWFSLRRRRR